MPEKEKLKKIATKEKKGDTPGFYPCQWSARTSGTNLLPMMGANGQVAA
jgi:hypothetical protein